MNTSWFFPAIEPYRVQGRGLAEDNFAAEDRNHEEIMGREGYQNALDARAPGNTGTVRVTLKVLGADQIDIEYLRSVIPTEYESRLESATAGASKLEFLKARVLVLEDFGTTGLEGMFTDSTADGANENWNAFWFREGEGAKAGPSSNGRAGQGKVTFYRLGVPRAVLGFTVRQSDSRALLMGRSSFRRNYVYAGQKYERDSFWRVGQGKEVVPTEDTIQIEKFRLAFGIERRLEPGLSLVIPFPVSFDSAELVRTAIADFYLPIARGRLEVEIDGEVITATNLDSKVDYLMPDEVAREKRSSFTKGFREMVQRMLEDEKRGKAPTALKKGWEKAAVLREEFLPEGALDELRSALDRGDRISVRFPVTVKPKQTAPIETWFDVHMEVPEHLDRVEEAYIRRDLLIGSETHLAASSYLPKARALTLIEDDGMSAFLADAEEPTHLKWNASRPRLAEDYKIPKDLVRAARQAAPRLLALLSGGDVKRDVKALARYFTKPAEKGKRHDPGGRGPGRDTTPKVSPPPSKPKLFKLDTGVDWVMVRPNGGFGPQAEDLPMECELETAYEGLDQDPFGAYDPFDFDLSVTKIYSVTSRGVTNLKVKHNKAACEIIDPDFELRISGFDPNIRLRARMTYKEKADGATIDSE
jgi:hypothetical protein